MTRLSKEPLAIPDRAESRGSSLGLAVSSLMAVAIAATWLTSRALGTDPGAREDSAVERLTRVLCDPPTIVALATIVGSFLLSTLILWRLRRAQTPHVPLGIVERLREVVPAEDGTPDETSPAANVDAVLARIDVLHDRSESLLVQNHLLAYESNRLKAVVDHIPDGVLATSGEGKILYVNRAAAAMLGVERDAVVGRPLRQASPEIEPLADQAHRTGRAILYRRTPDGERALSLRRASIADSRGELTGTVFSLRDVTQQQSANRAQSEFISQISHELKAPLNTIVTYVDALADPELLTDDERREYFNNLNSEAQRMARLISNLLEISRIELGGLSAKFNFLKPTDLLQSLAASTATQMDAHGHVFQTQIPETLPPLFGDKDLLSVAFSNLLANAIKYTPDGGTVTLSAREDSGAVVVEVRDTGIGIPQDMTERIFERFVRSEQDDIQARPGSGLGLALVREIIELHEGDVDVESRLSEGSVFRVRLPMRAVNDQINLSAA